MRNPMRLGCGLLALCLLSAGSAYADEVQIDFNLDAFRAAYTLEHEPKGLEFEFAWLHDSKGGDVGSAGLHLLGLIGPAGHPMQTGLGGKVLVIDGDDDSGAAAALGGYMQYQFKRLERLGLRGEVYYAPKVLGVSGVESYLEASIRAAYEVHERVSVYLGWRFIDVNFESPTASDVDYGVNIGLRMKF